MKVLAWFIIFFIWSQCSSIAQAKIIISEIYANPTSGETEWIEIFNNGNIDFLLNGWQLWDQESKPSLIHQFSKEIINSNDYLLITLKNVLNNSGDTVIIYNEEQIIQDSLTYTSSDKEFSWSKKENNLENIFKTLPTPNDKNAFLEPTPLPSPTIVPTIHQPSPQPTVIAAINNVSKTNIKKIKKPAYPASIIDLKIDLPKKNFRVLQSIFIDPPSFERGAISVIMSSLLLLVPGLIYVKKQESF